MSVRIIAKIEWESPRNMSEPQAEQYFIRQIEEALAANQENSGATRIRITGRYKK